jgi:class 3 adenylate cyclase
MSTKFDKDDILTIVRDALDHAEGVWGKHGKALEGMTKKAIARDSAERQPSKIPRHEYVTENQEEEAIFIALVADIRKSSDHLLCDISKKTADASGLQRVYYETSSLLPALERTIQYEGGSVTEYLGDGILSLFYVKKENEKSAIYAAHTAAKNCIGRTLEIVNTELKARYRLPPLSIGIGLGMSEALISLVGLPGSSHPKAIGRCVYNATKLSAGIDEIFVDERLKREWPTSKGGKLQFVPRKLNKISGYRIFKKDE